MRVSSRTAVAVSNSLRISIAVGLALLAPVVLLADTVAGRVYGTDEKPLANMTFKAKPAKGETVEFKTNGSGAFSVFLDPGRYTVTPSQESGVQGTLNSLPQPAQQDIHLKKAGS